MSKNMESIQVRILAFIRDYYERNQMPPTLDEMARELKISLASASRYKETMKESSLLTEKKGSYRSIQLTDKGTKVLEALK